MKFEEILSALREGKKVTNSFIKNFGYKYIYYEGGTIFNSEDDLWHITYKGIVESDDWEIVREPKKVKLRDLTEEQYKKWFRDNCCCKNEDKQMSDCFNCEFYNVICNPEISRCWVKHKDLYSDKFLDQEVEIEEK